MFEKELLENENKNISELEEINVSSSLIKAYIINMGKALLLIGSLVGAYFSSTIISGTNPFTDALDTVGIPTSIALKFIIGTIGLYLFITTMSVSNLASHELNFKGNILTYSYGAFFKNTKTTNISNIIRVNYNEYGLLKIGNLVLELTGTADKVLTVQYVSRARIQCELINKLISFKKSQEMEALKDGVDESIIEN